jgi:hypothetical protein
MLSPCYIRVILLACLGLMSISDVCIQIQIWLKYSQQEPYCQGLAAFQAWFPAAAVNVITLAHYGNLIIYQPFWLCGVDQRRSFAF